MATAKAEEAEITCKNPECPVGILNWNMLHAHVTREKKCKLFYTSKEIESIKPKTSLEERKKLETIGKEKSTEPSNSIHLKIGKFII